MNNNLRTQCSHLGQSINGTSITTSTGNMIGTNIVHPSDFQSFPGYSSNSPSELLNKMRMEYNVTMNAEIRSSPKIREVTSSMEENNMKILRLLEANEILDVARVHMIKEAETEYMKTNKLEISSELLEKHKYPWVKAHLYAEQYRAQEYRPQQHPTTVAKQPDKPTKKSFSLWRK